MVDAVAAFKRAGVRTGLLSNSWGANSLRPHALRRALRRARDQRRGGDPQARPRDLRARRASGMGLEPAELRLRRRPARQPQAGARARHGDRAPHRAPRRRSARALRGAVGSLERRRTHASDASVARFRALASASTARDPRRPASSRSPAGPARAHPARRRSRLGRVAAATPRGGARAVRSDAARVGEVEQLLRSSRAGACRNSQQNRQIVRIDSSTIMIEPAVVWSASGEMPCAPRRARRRRRTRRRRRAARWPSTAPTSRTRDDVAGLRRVAEPRRRRQRPEQAHPHVGAEEDEGQVLERVERLVAQRGLVQRRDVPGVAG